MNETPSSTDSGTPLRSAARLKTAWRSDGPCRHADQSVAWAGVLASAVNEAAIRPTTEVAPSHLGAAESRDTFPPENECQGAGSAPARPSTLATNRPLV